MVFGYISNQNIFSIDWAYAERQAAIAAIGRGPQKKPRGEQRVKVWMIDASAPDKRSVKAQLNGHSSPRVIWWNLFSAIYRALSRSRSLERAMFDFHRLHHFFTLSYLETAEEHRRLANAIRKEGLCRAVKQYAADLMTSANQHKQ